MASSQGSDGVATVWIFSLSIADSWKAGEAFLLEVIGESGTQDEYSDERVTRAHYHNPISNRMAGHGHSLVDI